MKELGVVVCFLLFASACSGNSETVKTVTTTIPTTTLATTTTAAPTTTAVSTTTTTIAPTTTVASTTTTTVSPTTTVTSTTIPVPTSTINQLHCEHLEHSKIKSMCKKDKRFKKEKFLEEKLIPNKYLGGLNKSGSLLLDLLASLPYATLDSCPGEYGDCLLEHANTYLEKMSKRDLDSDFYDDTYAGRLLGDASIYVALTSMACPIPENSLEDLKEDWLILEELILKGTGATIDELPSHAIDLIRQYARDIENFAIQLCRSNPNNLSEELRSWIYSRYP